MLLAQYGLAGGDGDGGHGKGAATLTLTEYTGPLGLHLSHVRQLQLAAVETLAETTFETPAGDANQREMVLRTVRELAVASVTRAVIAPV